MSSDHRSRAAATLVGRSSARLDINRRQASARLRGMPGTISTGVGAIQRSRAAARSSAGLPPAYGDRPVSIW
jgi:hypothetical protein